MHLITVLAAAAPALAQTTTSTIITATTTSLFVIETAPGNPTPEVVASIKNVDTSLSDTTYFLSCSTPKERDDEPEETPRGWKAPPCNLLDGAHVTVGPQRMVLDLNRQAQIISASTSEGSPEESMTVFVDVLATATCTFDDDDVGCDGHLTNRPTTVHMSEGSTVSTESRNGDVSTIQVFHENYDSEDHYILVTLTNGHSDVPSVTTISGTRTTSSETATTSSAGGPRATGQAALAGVVAVVGGMVLV